MFLYTPGGITDIFYVRLAICKINNITPQFRSKRDIRDNITEEAELGGFESKYKTLTLNAMLCPFWYHFYTLRQVICRL